MESGNQDWKGNCADLVNAASTKVMTTHVVSPELSQILESNTSVMTVVPAAPISTLTAANRPSPPPTVTSSVRTAGFLACEPDLAIRKNEAKVVPSQATYSTMRSLAKTRMSRSEEHTSELQSRGHLVCRL